MYEKLPRGARNPKLTRITVRLAVTTDDKLEAMADKLGLNKGTTSVLCLGMGLAILEQTFQSEAQERVKQFLADPKAAAAAVEQEMEHTLLEAVGR